MSPSRFIGVLLGIVWISPWIMGPDGQAAEPMPPGRYEVVAKLSPCEKKAPSGNCAVVRSGTRLERRLPLQRSKWDKALGSVGELRVNLTGTWSGETFTPSKPPRLYRENPNKFWENAHHVRRLGD